MTPFQRIELVMPWVSEGSQEELRKVRDAITELVEAHKKVREFLGSDQWGEWTYIEGHHVYNNLDDHAAIIDAALSPFKEEA